MTVPLSFMHMMLFNENFTNLFVEEKEKQKYPIGKNHYLK